MATGDPKLEDELLDDPPVKERYTGDEEQLLEDPPAPVDDYRGGEDELLERPPDRDRHVGGEDQLLDNPPETDYHLGRFAGYQAGSGIRRFLFLGVGITMLIGVVVIYWYLTTHRAPPVPIHALALPEGAELSDRPRTMIWSSGKARLGLTREPPGLMAIELPDRRIRLADGVDSAQVRVHVDDGVTIEVTLLYGDIVEEPREAE